MEHPMGNIQKTSREILREDTTIYTKQTMVNKNINIKKNHNIIYSNAIGNM